MNSRRLSASSRLNWWEKISFALLLAVFFTGAFGSSAFALTCGDCHGDPPVDEATRNGATGGFPGSHNKHAGTGALESLVHSLPYR